MLIPDCLTSLGRSQAGLTLQIQRSLLKVEFDTRVSRDVYYPDTQNAIGLGPKAGGVLLLYV